MKQAYEKKINTTQVAEFYPKTSAYQGGAMESIITQLELKITPRKSIESTTKRNIV